MRVAVTFRSLVLCSIYSIGMFSLPTLASAQQPSLEKPIPDSRFWDASLLSKPAYGVRTLFNVLIPMRDGVRLSVDLYLPDAPGQFPTLLWRTPYSNNSAGEVARAAGTPHAAMPWSRQMCAASTIQKANLIPTSTKLMMDMTPMNGLASSPGAMAR